MLNNKTIVLDLDGTILNSNKVIQDKDLKTLINLSKFNSVIIASGRHYLEVERIINLYRLNNIVERLIISRNGQQIYDIKERKIVRSMNVKYDELKKIIYELDNKNIYWYLIQGKQLFCTKIKYNVLKYLENKRYNINILSNISELKNLSIEKIIINSSDIKELKDMRNILIDNYNVDLFKIEREKIYNNIQYWQNNILPKNVNKYTAVQYVTKKIGLSKDVIAFGDGINDYELLTNANYSICMENSCDDLKKVCNFITKSNDNNGFAFAINTLNKLTNEQ